MQELLWDCQNSSQNGLKLGEDVDVVITDTVFHQNEINHFLSSRGITGVTCMTYASYVQAQEVFPILLEETFRKESDHVIDIDEFKALTPMLLQHARVQPELRQKREDKDYFESIESAMRQAFCHK